MSRATCGSIVAFTLVLLQLAGWSCVVAGAQDTTDSLFAAWLTRIKVEAEGKRKSAQQGESDAHQALANNQRMLARAQQANDEESAGIAREGIAVANTAIAKWRIAADRAQGCLDGLRDVEHGRAQALSGTGGSNLQKQIDWLAAACPDMKSASSASRPRMDEIVVPPPRLTGVELVQKDAAIRREQAWQVLLPKLQGPRAQAALREAARLRQQGEAHLAELRSQAALEQARAEATADVRKELAQQERLRSMLRDPARREFHDPLVERALREAEADLRSAELEAEARLRQGIVLPEDYDLTRLFGWAPPVRVWPGPANPGAPLPNPLVEEARREKVVELVLWERRQKERLLAVFNDPSFDDDLIADALKRLK